MIRQQIKDVYYSLTRILTVPNFYLARMRVGKRKGTNGHYVHLGCGPDYIPGMINIDANLRRKIDLWLDLRNGLPFPTGSVFFVYCSHTLEHFFPDDALRLLREIRRILRPDGVARIAVPSFQHAMDIAIGKFESIWPRSFDDRLGQAINYLFCDGQHKYAYSFGVLSNFAHQAGFKDIMDYSLEHGCQAKKYGDVEVGNEPEGSLVVELRPEIHSPSPKDE